MKGMSYIVMTKNRLIGVILAILAVILMLHSDCGADDRKTRVVTFLASGTVTASTTYSSGFEVSAYAEGQILVNVTAEGGTSTIDITVQTSDDNTTYYDHTTCAQITATGQYRYAATNFGKYMRLKYVVGGTSFTFAVAGVFKN
jgi:hypothetical protein